MSYTSTTIHRTCLALATIAVLAAIITGLILAGSPAQERLRRLDQQRINDLQQISGTIPQYVNDHHALPTALSAINNPTYTPIPLDPETHAAYGYVITSTSTYQLCATFDAPATTIPDNLAPAPYAVPQSFQHPAGYFCFSYSAPLPTVPTEIPRSVPKSTL